MSNEDYNIVKIYVDNIYIHINGLSKSEETELWNILSFEVPTYGVQQIIHRHLYNKKTKKSYTGLLPYVIKYMNKAGIEFTIIDKREKPIINGDFKLVDYIDEAKTIKFEPRPYQEEIVSKMKSRGIVQAPTGAGKTCMMAMLIAKFNVKPVVIFADKISLCQQIKEEVSKFLGVEVGIVGDGIKDYKDITVCSLLSTEEEYVRDAKLAMFDECLDFDTLVTCRDRNYYIGDIVNNKLDVEVLTYNTVSCQHEYKKITGYLKKPCERKVLRILVNIPNIGNREVICTDNHKFYSVDKREYIEAQYLTSEDTFFTVVADEGYLSASFVAKEEWFLLVDNYVYDIEVEDNHNFYANDVLVSNCHHIPSNTCMEVANKCINAFYRVGLSATPWRDAGDDMLIEAALAKKGETVLNASRLIELGYLIKPTILFVPVEEVFQGKNYNDLYNKAIVNNERRNRMIYKITKKMLERKRKILILIKNIKHGDKIKEALLNEIGETINNVSIINPKNGKEQTLKVKNIEFLSGADDTARRRAVIEGMKQGFCDVMIASSVADEGLDLPILDTLILAGGGKSSTRAFQRVGRVIRKYEGKENAYVFDFVDYTPMLRRHSRVRKRLYLTEPLWDIRDFVVNPDVE